MQIDCFEYERKIIFIGTITVLIFLTIYIKLINGNLEFFGKILNFLGSLIIMMQSFGYKETFNFEKEKIIEIDKNLQQYTRLRIVEKSNIILIGLCLVVFGFGLQIIYYFN